MPWLVRDGEEGDAAPLLLVHVPRCGGTSLLSKFDVASKAARVKGCCSGLLLRYFFYRYQLLESQSFPVFSYENLYAVLLVAAGCVVWVEGSSMSACNGEGWCPPILALWMWCSAVSLFVTSTLVMSSPVLARVDTFRRAVLVVAGSLCCDAFSSREYAHGCSREGFLQHLTARDVLRLGYASGPELRQSGLSIVRNPYSRMVSVYHYSRFGSLESFEHFVREWRARLQLQREQGVTGDRHVFCHVLSQRAFTHDGDAQLVPWIVRGEELPRDEASAAALRPALGVDPLPEHVRAALRDLPHANARAADGAASWWQLYTQETMDLVLEMYWEDFETFGYSRVIAQRPDLVPLSLDAVSGLVSPQLAKALSMGGGAADHPHTQHARAAGAVEDASESDSPQEGEGNGPDALLMYQPQGRDDAATALLIGLGST
jgi:hypothetical protein